MRLEEIMTGGVLTVAADEAADRAWTLMKSRRVRHLVVCRGRDKDVVGVLSERDLGGPRGASLRNGRRVADLMTPSVVSAEPGTTVRKAANLLRGRSIGCLPIMDGGKLVGIVTLSDLLDVVGRGLERPGVNTKRWTLRHRGRRPKAGGSVGPVRS
jgi:acetoin utilization protein AcuB